MAVTVSQIFCYIQYGFRSKWFELCFHFDTLQFESINNHYIHHIRLFVIECLHAQCLMERRKARKHRFSLACTHKNTWSRSEREPVRIVCQKSTIENTFNHSVQLWCWSSLSLSLTLDSDFSVLFSVPLPPSPSLSIVVSSVQALRFDYILNNEIESNWKHSTFPLNSMRQEDNKSKITNK